VAKIGLSLAVRNYRLYFIGQLNADTGLFGAAFIGSSTDVGSATGVLMVGELLAERLLMCRSKCLKQPAIFLDKRERNRLS
jgi:hypothetical protein